MCSVQRREYNVACVIRLARPPSTSDPAAPLHAPAVSSEYPQISPRVRIFRPPAAALCAGPCARADAQGAAADTDGAALAPVESIGVDTLVAEICARVRKPLHRLTAHTAAQDVRVRLRVEFDPVRRIWRAVDARARVPYSRVLSGARAGA
jgi:hypothetical protein